MCLFYNLLDIIWNKYTIALVTFKPIYNFFDNLNYLDFFISYAFWYKKTARLKKNSTCNI